MSGLSNEAEQVGTAVALVEWLGFPAARARADEMIAELVISTASDAAEGLEAWSAIRAYVDALEASAA